jgi:hypothetical protein
LANKAVRGPGQRAYRFEKYGTRFWAVRDPSNELVAVTVYRRGASEVVKRLSAMEEQTHPEGHCKAGR